MSMFYSGTTAASTDNSLIDADEKVESCFFCSQTSVQPSLGLQARQLTHTLEYRCDAGLSGSGAKQMVRSELILDLLMRHAWNQQPVGAFSGFAGDQGVDNGLFGGVDRGLKQGCHGEVGMHLHARRCRQRSLRLAHRRVGRR